MKQYNGRLQHEQNRAPVLALSEYEANADSACTSQKETPQQLHTVFTGEVRCKKPCQPNQINQSQKTHGAIPALMPETPSRPASGKTLCMNTVFKHEGTTGFFPDAFGLWWMSLAPSKRFSAEQTTQFCNRLSHNNRANRKLSCHPKIRNYKKLVTRERFIVIRLARPGFGTRTENPTVFRIGRAQTNFQQTLRSLDCAKTRIF